MSVVAGLKRTYRRAADFFSKEIWQRPLDELSTRRAWAYQTSRITYCTVRGLVLGDALQVRAAALTYFTVLSLVPLLAFGFALLKGFGAYDLLVERSIRPYVLGLLSGNDALRTAFDQILGFVDRTGVTSLGFIGLLTLLYAATRLLRNIEGALNELWSVKNGREPLQQLRDYVAIIVVTPICLMAATGLTATEQALDLFRAAGETLGMGALVDWLLSVLGPLTVIFLGLLFLYKVMPYTNVRFLSAVTGAAIGSILWYAVLIIHVRFQVGVAQYNALYSSFGAVPIFLAWLQLSWLVVMVGAQIASTHQNSRGIAQRRRLAALDRAESEVLGVAAVLRIGDAFRRCEEPLKQRDMSVAFAVPEPLLAELIDRLTRAGLVAQAGQASDPSYVLLRPLERVTLKEVLDALRETHESAVESVGDHVPFGNLAARVWRDLNHALANAPENRTLRELLESQRGDDGAADHAEAPRTAAE